MHMCITSIIYIAILVFGITAVGFLLGNINKFGDSDTIIETEENE